MHLKGKVGMQYRTREGWLKKSLYVKPNAKPTAKTVKGEFLYNKKQCEYSWQRSARLFREFEEDSYEG